MNRNVLSKLFGFTTKTLYNWREEDKKQRNRPILTLIEKYFQDDDIKEFLETKKIERFDLFEEQEKILSSFRDKEMHSLSIYEPILRLNTLKLISQLKKRYEKLLPIAEQEKIKEPENIFFTNCIHEELYKYNEITIKSLEDYIKDYIFHASLVEKIKKSNFTPNDIYIIQKIIHYLYDNGTLKLIALNLNNYIDELVREIKKEKEKLIQLKPIPEESIYFENELFMYNQKLSKLDCIIDDTMLDIDPEFFDEYEKFESSLRALHWEHLKEWEEYSLDLDSLLSDKLDGLKL